MKVNHIGIAVKNLKNSKKKYVADGYVLLKQLYDNNQKAILALMRKGDSVIELIYAEDTTSPAYNMCRKAAETQYHICYETSNLEKEIVRYTDDGFLQITNICDTPLLDGRVCFMYSKDTGLVELYEIHL